MGYGTYSYGTNDYGEDSSSSSSSSMSSSSSSFSSSSCSSSYSSSSCSSSCSSSYSSSSCSSSCSSSYSSSSCSSSCSSSFSSSSSSSPSDSGIRYYVSDGATATWDDPLNWAYISGGYGGAGVPDATNDVVFDANSPDCDINITDAAALTVTTESDFSNTISFTVSNAKLTIEGDGDFSYGTLAFGTNNATLICNNTDSGTLTSFSTVTAGDGTVCVKRTNELAANSVTFYNLEIGDNGYTTVFLSSSLNFTNNFTLKENSTFDGNGNVINYTGTPSNNEIITFESGCSWTDSGSLTRMYLDPAGSGTATIGGAGMTSTADAKCNLWFPYDNSNTMTLRQSADKAWDYIYFEGPSFTYETDGYDLELDGGGIGSYVDDGELDLSGGTGGTSTVTVGPTDGLDISGTLTQGDAILNVTNTDSDSLTCSGTFNGGTGNITVYGSLGVHFGSFVQGAQTIIVYKDLVVNGDYFTKNASGLIKMEPSGAVQKLDIADTVDLGNIEIDAGYNEVQTTDSTTNINVSDFTLTSGTFTHDSGNWFNIGGSFTLTDGTMSVSDNMEIDGSISMSGGTLNISSSPNIIFNNSLSLSGTSISDSTGNWFYDPSGGGGDNIDFNGETVHNLNLGSDNDPNSNITGNVVVDGTLSITDNVTVTVTSGVTVEADAISWNGTSGNLITLRASGATHWYLICNGNYGSNSVSYVDVQLCDAYGSPSDPTGQTIDATDGTNTDSGDNLNWDFGSGASSSSSFSSSSSSCSSSFSSSSCSSSFSSSSCSSSFSSSSCSSSFSSSSCSSSFSSSSCSSSFSSSSSSSPSDSGIRYYVSDGATATWDDPLNWAYISGGYGGAGVPDATNDVVFDANSSRSCPLNSNANCKSVTFSSYSHTLTTNSRTLEIEEASSIVGGTVDISSGTIILKESSTIRPSSVTTGGTWSFEASSTLTIKVDRNTNLGNVSVSGAGTLVVDQDATNGGLLCDSLISTTDIESTSSAYIDAEEWILTSCSLTAGSNVYFRGSATFDTVTVGSTGTFIIAADGVYDFDGATFPNMSTASGGKTVSFQSNFSTFGTMTLNDNDDISFSTSGTFNFNTIDWTGSSGNLITISSSGIGTWALDVDIASPTVSYIDVTNSNASFGNSIDATDGTSIDNGGNTNWLFPSSSSSSSSCSSSLSSSSSCSCSLSCSSSSSFSSCSSSSSYSCSSSSSYSSCSSSVSSCSSSSSFSSSSFSSCSSSFSSCSSSSVSGSSFTARFHERTTIEEEEGIVYYSNANIEDFLYAPFKGVPRYIFNRGYPIDENAGDRYEELTRNAIGNHFLTMIKYPGIVDRRNV
jgi:hypothetical protein